MADTKPPLSCGPVIVLVQPQLGENIGASARAMLNCGITELRLVNPRDGWPSEKAISAASGADSILSRAKVFDSLGKAISDLSFVSACTSRLRDIDKLTVTAEGGVLDLHSRIASGQRCGILFGGERSGLNNDDIALADNIINIKLNPEFSSLNLAQAVLVISYAWLRSDKQILPSSKSLRRSLPATKSEILGLFEHLETELTRGGFLYPKEKAPSMIRNIRALLTRAELSGQEVKTLRGVVAAIKRSGRV